MEIITLNFRVLKISVHVFYKCSGLLGSGLEQRLRALCTCECWVSLTTKGSSGVTAHTCSGRHSQYSCELLAWIPGVAFHIQLVRHC